MAKFSFWGYGDKELVRGSGLFVGENGVATNHHFNPINSEEFFSFTSGTYEIELVAKPVNKERLVSLSKVELNVPKDAFDSNISPDSAVYFNWSAEEQRYIESIENRETPLPSSSIIESSFRLSPKRIIKS